MEIKTPLTWGDLIMYLPQARLGPILKYHWSLGHKHKHQIRRNTQSSATD